MSYFLILLLFLTLCPISSQAKDLGMFGQTFPILEKSLLQYLEEKLSDLTENEKIQIQKTIQNHYVKKISRPSSADLPEAKNYRCFYYDPTIIYTKEVKDHKGNVIISEGTHFNPLEKGNLSEDLLFFDGDNSKHLEWAKKNIGKWILTCGNPISLENVEKRPVYFDQMGKISHKLAITSIPAKVSQEGVKLKIEEFPCHD